VKLLENEPFALVGINSDGDAAKVKEIMAREGLSWRNAVDGTTEGPWATAWNVHSWPTLLLIDKDGVIRERDPRGDRMLPAVREVLARK
jgi:redoxin